MAAPGCRRRRLLHCGIVVGYPLGYPPGAALIWMPQVRGLCAQAHRPGRARERVKIEFVPMTRRVDILKIIVVAAAIGILFYYLAHRSI